MYHGYARSGRPGMIAGMPPHGPGAIGPGMGYAPTYSQPPMMNPMLNMPPGGMRPGMMGPGMNYNYNC